MLKHINKISAQGITPQVYSIHVSQAQHINTPEPSKTHGDQRENIISLVLATRKLRHVHPISQVTNLATIFRIPNCVPNLHNYN